MNTAIDYNKNKIDQDPNSFEGLEYEDFIAFNKQKLEDLVKNLRKTGKTKICLEGGHIYTDEKPSKKHFQALKTTFFLKRFFEENGFLVTPLLLVDNYNSDKNNECFSLEEYLAAAQEIGLSFEHILMESEMVDVAKIILETLEKLHQVTEKEGVKVLGDNKANLLDTKNGKYSCALLDAALTILKLKNFGDCAVNVLDGSYKSQQRNVKKILGELSPNDREALFSFFI